VSFNIAGRDPVEVAQALDLAGSRLGPVVTARRWLTTRSA